MPVQRTETSLKRVSQSADTGEQFSYLCSRHPLVGQLNSSLSTTACVDQGLCSFARIETSEMPYTTWPPGTPEKEVGFPLVLCHVCQFLLTSWT